MNLPDDLYRRVKAKAALQGRPVREVTIDLYRRWLDEGAEATGSPQQWLENWIRLGRETLPDSGPSTREILESDRGRI